MLVLERQGDIVSVLFLGLVSLPDVVCVAVLAGQFDVKQSIGRL